MKKQMTLLLAGLMMLSLSAIRAEPIPTARIQLRISICRGANFLIGTI